MTDLSKLRISPTSADRETDPVRIFASRTQRGSIEGLYGPQQEALTTWHHKHREKSDVMFSLPTGGGKTLVGLLAAQSLVNENKGKVFYACATNQLIEQARSQAEECGISVATYFDRNWHNEDEFYRGRAFLLTNYHVLFNGRSKFLKETPHGVILDDAHVAPQIIRDCFTLTLGRQHPAWAAVTKALSPYFESNPYYASFRRFQIPTQGRDSSILFVPGWFINENIKTISSALEDNGVEEEESTKFAYPHLRLHLAHCCFLIGQNRIEIGPSVLPTHSLPYFHAGVRRIYMTATLPSRYECIRTFGMSRAEPIVPAGKAGAAQRLFVFARGQTDDELAYTETRRLAAPRKACIIVPSAKAAEKWKDLAAHYESKEGHKAIRDFAGARDSRKIVLAALYDGIDLPGKSCNVLILDGLPRGAFLHDQFREDALDVRALRALNTASRIVQSIGRIFRSNTDHGVVILADRFQQTWLLSPDHLPHIPALLQQQILLGYEIRRLVEAGQVRYEELMTAVIDGREDWDSFYNSEIAKIVAERKPKESHWGDRIGQAEYEAFKHLWEGRFKHAALALNEIAGEIEPHEKALSAWFTHWSGVALQLAGEITTATLNFTRAASVKSILGRPPGAGASGQIEKAVPGPQARRLASAWSPALIATLTAARELFNSDGGPNAESHETALRDLGTCLGLLASRPDHDVGTGPDVLWHLPEEGSVFSLEAKTQKSNPKAYKKRVVGKLHDDEAWLDKNVQTKSRRVSIIGPLVPVVRQANPKPSYRITELHEFKVLLDRVTNAFHTIAAAAPSATELPVEIEVVFRFNGLIWPGCIDSMAYRFAVDLQDDLDEESEG